jgi:hypothetical protein
METACPLNAPHTYLITEPRAITVDLDAGRARPSLDRADARWDDRTALVSVRDDRLASRIAERLGAIRLGLGSRSGLLPKPQTVLGDRRKQRPWVLGRISGLGQLSRPPPAPPAWCR